MDETLKQNCMDLEQTLREMEDLQIVLLGLQVKAQFLQQLINEELTDKYLSRRELAKVQ